MAFVNLVRVVFVSDEGGHEKKHGKTINQNITYVFSTFRVADAT